MSLREQSADESGVQRSVEATLPNAPRMRITGDRLDLREMLNVVEASVRWWRGNLQSHDAATRMQAAQAIDELSQILHSLSLQIAAGRETVRISTQAPAKRAYGSVCRTCGHGNRHGALFCRWCGERVRPDDRAEFRTRSSTMRVRIAADTDVGRARTENQDYVRVEQVMVPTGVISVLVLADGMGGANAGAIASKLAVDHVLEYVCTRLTQTMPTDDVQWALLLRTAIAHVNEQIYRLAQSRADYAGMGTTLIVAVLSDWRMHTAAVGDSRAYLLNANGVFGGASIWQQLTIDHSLVARLVDIGRITPAQARVHPQRNMLYRAVGTDPAVEVDIRSDTVTIDDTLLLCSDGLINLATDDEIAALALRRVGLEQIGRDLINMANERGGSDNISIVIAQMQNGSEF